MKRLFISRVDAGDGNALPAPSRLPRTEMAFAARGVIVSGSDVLADDSAWLRWLYSQLRREAAVGPFPAFCESWEAAATGFFIGQSTFHAALERMLSPMHVCPSLRAEIAIAARSYRERSRAEARPYPGVVKAIGRLAAQGLVVAVLANCESSSDALRRWLTTQHITGLSLVATSREINAVMPSPAAFVSTVARMRLPMDDVIFVAARKSELRGAVAVGLRVIGCGEPEADDCPAFDSLADVAPRVVARSSITSTTG